MRGQLREALIRSRRFPLPWRVAHSEIETEGSGYEAEDAICDDVQYDIYLDKNFKVTNKVKED